MSSGARLLAIKFLLLTFCLPLATSAHSRPSPRSHVQRLGQPRIEVKKVKDNVYRTELFAWGMQAMNNVFVVGQDGIILVDGADAGFYPLLRSAISNISTKPVKFLINTHWHHDHTGLNQDFFTKEGTTILAHKNTRPLLTSPQHLEDLEDHPTDGVSPDFPALPPEAFPTISVAGNMTLHSGDERLDLVYIEKSHSNTDLAVYLRDANVVHLGDLFFNDLFPMLDRSSGGTLDTLIATCEKVLSQIDKNTLVIPAHGEVGNHESLRDYIEMLKVVRARVTKLIKLGLNEEQVIAQKPLADLESKWGWFFIPGDVLTKIVYRDLTAPRPD